MSSDFVPNVLADRYASPAMLAIWSPRGRIVLEREVWIAVMKAQRDLGLAIPAEAIADYERVKDRVDLDDIARRERVTRHDVKARIESFCAMTGHEHVHKGMTSRDLTENVEQLQIRRSLELVLAKTVAGLRELALRADEFRHVTLTARTHNVAAQPTTLGKRLAMFGEELLHATDRLEQTLASYPVRGLKGATGTQLDSLTLFGGSTEKVQALENRFLSHLGFASVLGNVGQVYPRSLDFEVVSALFQTASPVSSFAKTLRLMAGHELASEGFAKGQVGSSAMPHKMNSRSCERINGFHTILKGHLAMAEGLAGDQWNEGDVSCSVVRRVLLPDAFFAFDGLLETFLVILGQMEIFPEVVARENRYYQPFLATTTFLMEAVKAGAGREAAHESIKEHSIAVVRDLRNGVIRSNDLIERLARDVRLGLSLSALQKILDQAESLVGNADTQVGSFLSAVQTLRKRHPRSDRIAAGDIL